MDKQLYAPMPANGEADIIIIQPNGNIYNCYLLPGYENKVGEDIENQPLWRIEKIEKHEAEGVTTFRRLYPNGSTTFSFCAANHSQYEYSFKK